MSRRPLRSPERALIGVVGVAAFFGLWELLVRGLGVRPFVLRAPSQALHDIWKAPHFYWTQAITTGREALIGFLLALLIALLWGALMAASNVLDAASTPVLVLVMVTPFATYAPSVVLWLGAGWKPIEFVVGLACLPAFIFAAADGMRSADTAARELLHSVDASRWEVLWRLRLPAAMPSLFTAARWNVGLALVIAYLVEGYALVTRGLGAWGKRFASFNNANGVWAVVFCMAALGVVGMLVIAAVRARILHWHASERRPTA
jgi:NitT/TauT family transport system permease protein